MQPLSFYIPSPFTNRGSQKRNHRTIKIRDKDLRTNGNTDSDADYPSCYTDKLLTVKAAEWQGSKLGKAFCRGNKAFVFFLLWDNPDVSVIPAISSRPRNHRSRLTPKTVVFHSTASVLDIPDIFCAYFYKRNQKPCNVTFHESSSAC